MPKPTSLPNRSHDHDHDHDHGQRLAPIARYATVLLILAMFLMTHLPAHAFPRELAFADKIVHCFVYMLLAFSVLTSWELTIGQLRPHHYFTVWLVGTLYGAFDEVTQIPIGRHADVRDWMADIVGIVFGLTLFRLLRPLISRLVNLKIAVR